jgi:hypothetical protein
MLAGDARKRRCLKMKMSVMLAALMGSVLLLATSGCSGGNPFGPSVDRTYDLTGFTRVEVSSAFRYEIRQSDSYSVVVSAREPEIRGMDVRLEGSTLRVARRAVIGGIGPATVRIQMPKIEGLSVSGASRGTASGFASEVPCTIDVGGASRLDADMQTGDLNLMVSGASRLTGKIRASRLNSEASGASHIDLEGSAPLATIEVSGASQWNAPQLLHRNADLNVTGASRANVNVSDSLVLDASGASTVNYTGSPSVKQNVTGNSTVRSR